MSAKKMGRPSKFPTLNLEQVRKLYLKAFTDFEIADFFGISKQSLYVYLHNHQDFSDSVKGWKLEADKRVERSLLDRASGYSHPHEEIFCKDGVVTRVQTIKHYPPDTMAMMYWLNNRQRLNWKQKPEAEEDESLINNDLEFKDVPKDVEAQHRFAQYINDGKS